jgi:cytochrome oxidase Cu insertion factor (SCO1/SenC/PrrC family)
MKPVAAVLAGLLLSACAKPPVETMPPFALVDQSGTIVRSESLRGHAVVVSFVFTTCVEACPLITAQLARAQARARAEKLDGRVRFVSITLDPVTDTPEVLRRYADAYGIDLTTWHFLTGASDDVARVIHAFGLTTGRWREAGARWRGAGFGRHPIVHGSLVVLVDGEGRIAEARTDLELDPTRLLASLRKLLG